ncbi:carbohydrate ABC transporter permease [Cutibacterium sp.]|uniref:carbohydrate ABC transporter permease n=1 Tax=Cutibacterium sp. TaxID=1912221 RepID=UPI0026DD35F5|nr:carbohydrate ABC transporter permease [Cutibacterium sp.]MDO4413283.1 carbohydrate ABC transporter permease [Cutibacterium sp.]
MSTTHTFRPVKQKSRPVKQKPWRNHRSFDPTRPTFAGLIGRYLLLIFVVIISIGPFVWQLSTSLKGVSEDIYSFPPHLVPQDFTVDAYRRVARVVPIFSYAWHSIIVAAVCVIGNVVLSSLAGYALTCMAFRGKKIVMGILLSVLLLPGEVTLTSQYLIIKGMGLANTLAGVAIPGIVGAINVLLMATACRAVPTSVLDAATVDGANTWAKIRYIVWPNIKGMASVVAVFSFIGAWDDFLWPLVVLNDPNKYTLTVGMQYLNSTMSTDPREVAAGTIIALVPIIIVFASMQKIFFRGVETGAVKG